ncbi:SLC13 family permease [Terribacillus saccharophilus]|uniref:SLC13 family permease n=1 Tax=Terribacillus saccharophilus TaxID=361277 RepID=UPI000C9C8ABA|nr:SLC13 family permease [Terribacillus goriensis]
MGIEMLTIISVAALLLMFVINAKLPINMGILGFVAAFILATITGVTEDEIFGEFPVNLFIILTGVTYFFGILQDNGTIDLITASSLKLVKGRRMLIPWIMFLLELLLTSIGTQGTAAIIIVAPIALRLAHKIGFNQLGMSLMVAWGMVGGIFSPLNVMGIIVRGVVEESGISFNANTLYLLSTLFAVGLAFLTFLIFGGFKRRKADQTSEISEDNAELQAILNPTIEVTPYRIVSLLALAALITLGMVFEMNMGFAGLTLGLILALFNPARQKEIVSKIPWSIILMVSGIVTYVGVLEQIGVTDYITHLVSEVDNPLLAILVTCYIGGIISAFVSTTGFLGAVVPLLIPMLATGDIWVMGAVAAVCIASSIVDICPFSTTGAIFVANAQGEAKATFYNHLLKASIFIIAAGPLVAWIVYVAFF